MARFARGWTIRDLSEVLGGAEKQVQRDESPGVTSASLERGEVRQVSGAVTQGLTPYFHQRV